MRRIYLLLVLIFAFQICGHAQQTWLWAKKFDAWGDNGSSFGSRGMATDEAGNTYMVGQIGTHMSPPSFVMDGVPVNTFGNPWNYGDVYVASFTCEGTYRWGMILDGGYNDKVCAIELDKMGGVYVSGEFRANFDPLATHHTHIGADTTLTDSSRNLFIIKFDTTGALQWVRRPQPHIDNYSGYPESEPMDMVVEDNGTVRFLCWLMPGIYADGAYTIADTGNYILTYGPNGNFISGMPISIDKQINTTVKMCRDDVSGQLYFSGYKIPNEILLIGGNTINSTMYITSFDGQGQHLWSRENTNTFHSTIGFYGDPVIDDSGFVYATGVSRIGDTFMNHISTNTFTTLNPATTAFIVKMDNNGNLVWATNASSSAGNSGDLICVRGDDEVVLAGRYTGSLTWPNYSGAGLVHPVSAGQNLFITRFNRHTGLPVKIDSISSAPQDIELSKAITADDYGHLYLAGEFKDSLFAGPHTLTAPVSDPFAMFFIKYGIDCCTQSEASFTFDLNNGFAYTGTQPYDSIQWVIDGIDTFTTPIPTNNVDSGMHNVCVTIFTQCGEYIYCDSIFVPSSVTGIAAFPELKIFPTPVTCELYINNVQEPLQYSILGISGDIIFQGKLRIGNNTVNTSSLAQGMYMLFIEDGKRKGVTKIIKQ